MKFLRSILLFPLALIRFVLVILITFYYIMVGFRRLKKHGFSRGLQKWVMGSWGRSILWAFGVKVDISSFPSSEHYILMPNHRSYIDIPLVVKYHQGTLVGKIEVGKWPMARTAAKITKPILVNRSKLKSLVETMKKIKESVDQKIPVILFPEGTTHTGPLTKPFKNGSFKIAADSQIPIIPLAIHYPDPGVAWVGNDTFIGHFFKQMGTLSTKVVMRYGVPIVHSDYEILKKQTREQIDSMLTEMAGLNLLRPKMVSAE